MKAEPVAYTETDIVLLYGSLNTSSTGRSFISRSIIETFQLPFV